LHLNVGPKDKQNMTSHPLLNYDSVTPARTTCVYKEIDATLSPTGPPSKANITLQRQSNKKQLQTVRTRFLWHYL